MKLIPGAARRAAVAVAVSAALLNAGCSNAPGVVAYVGRARITQKQVDSAVAAVSTTAQPGQTVSTGAVINAMIQGELATQIASDKNIAITDGERDTYLRTTNLGPLISVPGAKPVAYDVADTALVAKQLGPKAYLAEIAGRPVKLNPRYGVLDPKQKTILENQSGSLSSPAAQTP